MKGENARGGVHGYDASQKHAHPNDSCLIAPRLGAGRVAVEKEQRNKVSQRFIMETWGGNDTHQGRVATRSRIAARDGRQGKG